MAAALSRRPAAIHGRDQAAITGVVTAIRDLGGTRHLGHRADVTSPGQLEATRRRIVSRA
jgi:hypothetical protein